MKRTALVFMALAIGLFFTTAALAQHGQGAGGGHGMTGGAGSHGNSGHADKAAQPHSGAKTPTDMLGRNTKLATKLETLLPKGMTAQDACSGFKNLGQCVAAIHVSHNLGLSFTDMKAKMLGTSTTSTTTTEKPMSLGKAIQALAPTADAKVEAKKGQKQADDDLKG